MKKTNRTRLVMLTLVLVIGLSGCGSLPFGQSTPTQDVAAVQTSAAATAFVQLTGIANSALATEAAKPTATKVVITSPTSEPTVLEQITPTGQPGVVGLPVTATVPVAAPTTAGGVTIIVPPNTTPVKSCYASLFITDVTIPDNTVLKPLQRFTKIWRIQNNGTCNWDEGFGLVYFRLEKMNGTPVFFSGNDPIIKPGMQVDLPITMTAPEKKGTYYSEWIMVDDSGKSFGYPVYVLIEVK